MPSLHLLNKDGPKFPQPCQVGSGLMESGYWRVSIERAEQVIGHSIHFHRRKAEPAFVSGIVTDFRREHYTTKKGNTSPRTIFIFTPTEDAQIITDAIGWTLAGVKFVP
jgi:hypothetical protein